MRILVTADLRNETVREENDLIELFDKKAGIRDANSFLVTPTQLADISKNARGGGWRYVKGSYFGFPEDMLCYDNEAGSFIFLTIAHLMARGGNNE